MREPITEAEIWSALEELPDPELPQISLVDLGVILRVELEPEGQARVLLMPTFLGCPALELMRESIHERLDRLGLETQVEITREQLWSSERISERGRRKLAEAGIAPPAAPDTSGTLSAPIMLMEPAPCPYCGSRATALESSFGPTPCRAIAHCRTCKQPFEQFKPL